MARPKALSYARRLTMARLQQGFPIREIALFPHRGGKAARFEGQDRQGESLAALAMLPNIYMNQNLDIGPFLKAAKDANTATL